MFAVGGVERLAMGEGALDVAQPAAGLGQLLQSLRFSAAFSAPQSEWPQRMACFTCSTSTAYSMVAVQPSTSLPETGTTLPALRVINRSPGPVPKIRSGTTRESEQVIKRYSGACDSARR